MKRILLSLILILLMAFSVYFPWGKSANYKVVSTSYYGTSDGGSSGTVTTDDLLAFILGLY